VKKNYTVKETSKLLGVSTNTVYKYLEEGKLIGKRFGRGRFKIPYKQILPYVDASQAEISNNNLINPQAFTPSPEVSNMNLTSPPQDQVTPQEKVLGFVEEEKTKVYEGKADFEVKPGVGDIVFFRIFKGVVFLGLGIIYLFSISSLNSLGDTYLGDIGKFIIKLLPFGLISVGAFNLGEAFKPQRFLKFHLLADAFSSLILGFFALFSFIGGQYGLFVFATSFCAIAVGHLMAGIKTGEQSFSFLNSFSRFLLYVAVLGGAILIVSPNIMPIDTIAVYIRDHRELFSFIYFVILIVPLLYTLTPSGRNSTARLPYFILSSTLSLIIAVELTFTAFWDISYLAFLTGIFGLFLAFWIESQRVLDVRKLILVFFSFMWISASLIFGLFALKTSREEIKADALANMSETLEKLVIKINSDFEERSAVLTTFAGSGSIKKILEEGAEDEAISTAKSVFERLGNVERVLIYNQEGIAVGVYPRNTISQGTNFSSQEYFQATKASYKGYVSQVFENILGNPSVVHTEPIFENNEFVGMIAASLALENLAKDYQVGTTLKYRVEATDENGFIVFSLAQDEIGRANENLGVSLSKTSNENNLVANQEAETPKWNVLISTPIAPLVSKLSGMNIILSLLLIVNSVFSIAAGVIAASKKKQVGYSGSLPITTIDDLASLGQKPHFV